jgi:hypothetical protein
VIWLIVPIAWFYAYGRVKLKAFGVLGLATLTGLIAQLITPILMGFTGIDTYVILSYTNIIVPVLAIIYTILALYGIADLIKTFERKIQ